MIEVLGCSPSAAGRDSEKGFGSTLGLSPVSPRETLLRVRLLLCAFGAMLLCAVGWVDVTALEAGLVSDVFDLGGSPEADLDLGPASRAASLVALFRDGLFAFLIC